jgi:outer membrane protein W
MRKRTMALAAALLALGTAPLGAQDFLFGAPFGQITLRTGPVVPAAGSDLYDFFTEELTLGRGDFLAPSIAAELSFRVHSRVDLLAGAAFAQSNARSEYRGFVGTDDLPIVQSTRLSTAPMTVSARVFPLARGTAISNLAWVPARITPYVGAGGGVTWYRLEQEGEFLQKRDLTIFNDDYQSAGYGATAHVLAGADYWLTPRFGVNLDGRYRIGSAALRDDYRNWEPLDLSGLHAGVGITLRW